MLRAEANILELEEKIEARLEDVDRMKAHIELQKEEIAKAKQALAQENK